MSSQDHYPFGMIMPGRAATSGSGYRFGFNGGEKISEVYGEGNYVDLGERGVDVRLGRLNWSIDPLANKYPWQSPYALAANNPIALVDVLGMGPGDPQNHKVVKGDNLTAIGKKYGVSVDDLVKMNGIKDKNKISIGQNLIVNPEANFSHNPRGSYQNPDNPDGKEVSIDNIATVGMNFVTGSGEENSVIVGGGALSSVQNWSAVNNLVNSGLNEIIGDGKWSPGDVAYREFRPGDLPTNIKKGLEEAWEKIKKGENPWKDNSQNSPIHVIGSFNMSIRINANGTTATVCIYDSKTFKSFSDGNASDKYNTSRKDAKYKFLTSTYQRYLWNINLPQR